MSFAFRRTIAVRFVVEGFHFWPGARPPREYLGQRHRHLFHVEVRLEVKGNDREVEFHDLLDFCRRKWPGKELGPRSCERLASDLAAFVAIEWPGRWVGVSVFEDGEVGATFEMHEFRGTVEDVSHLQALE